MDGPSTTMARAERIRERLSRVLPPDHPVLTVGLSADLAYLYEIAGKTVAVIDEIDRNEDVDPALVEARVRELIEDWLLKASFYIESMGKHLRPLLEDAEAFAAPQQAGEANPV